MTQRAGLISREMDRVLNAEVRAVEEGHQARLVDIGISWHFQVTSDSTDAVYDVYVRTYDNGHVNASCSCPAGRRSTKQVPCKHVARSMQSLERKGELKRTTVGWVAA